MFDSKEKREARERLVRFKRAFSSPEGKEVLLDLMNHFYILRPHDGDPYKEGQRSVVLFILNQAKVKIEDYDKLLEGKDAET